MLPVPLDGFADGRLHLVVRLPAETLARLACIEVLLADLRAGGVLNYRLEVGAAHDLQRHVDDVEDGKPLAEAEIESLARDGGVFGKPLTEGEVAFRSVFHIQKIADEFAVAADDEGLSGQRGLDQAGDGAAEVEIPAAEEIAAARDGGLH